LRQTTLRRAAVSSAPRRRSASVEAAEREKGIESLKRRLPLRQAGKGKTLWKGGFCRQNHTHDPGLLTLTEDLLEPKGVQRGVMGEEGRRKRRTGRGVCAETSARDMRECCSENTKREIPLGHGSQLPSISLSSPRPSRFWAWG